MERAKRILTLGEIIVMVKMWLNKKCVVRGVGRGKLGEEMEGRKRGEGCEERKAGHSDSQDVVEQKFSGERGGKREG